MMSSPWRDGGQDISHRKCFGAYLPLAPSYVAEHPLRCIYSELHTLLTVTRLAAEALVSAGPPPVHGGSSYHSSILTFGDASCLPPPLSGFIASVESLSSSLHQQLVFLQQDGDEDEVEEEKDEEETWRNYSDDATGGAEERTDCVGSRRSRRGSVSSSFSFVNDLDYPSYHPHRTGTSSYRQEKKKMSRLLSLQEEHLAPFLFVAADFLPILQSIEFQTQSAYPSPSGGSNSPGVSWASLINVRPVIAVALASLNKFVGYDLLSPLRCMYSSSLTNQVLEAVLTCAHQQLQQLSGPSTPSSLPAAGHASSSSSPFSVFGSGGVGLYSAYLGGGSSHSTSANTPLILEEEEVLLHKALSVLSETLKSSSGFFITDEGLWEILKVCYLTVRQGRISVVLRSYTENLLVELLLHLFAPPRSSVLTDKRFRKTVLSPLSRICSPVREGEDERESETFRKREDREERRRSCKETGGEEEGHPDAHRGDEDVETPHREPGTEGHRHGLKLRRKERRVQEEDEEQEVRRRKEGEYFSRSRHRPHGLGSRYMALRFIAFLISHGLPFSSTPSSAPPSLRPDAEGGSVVRDSLAPGAPAAPPVASSSEKPSTTTSSSNTTKASTSAILHSRASSSSTTEGKSTSHSSQDTAGGGGGGDSEKASSAKPSGGKSRDHTKAASSSSSSSSLLSSSHEKPSSSSSSGPHTSFSSSSGRVPQPAGLHSSSSLSSLSSSGGIAEEEEEGENDGVYGSSPPMDHLEEEKRSRSSLSSTQVTGDDLYHIRNLEKDLFGMYEEFCAGSSSYSFFYHYYNTGSSQNPPWSKDEEEFNQEMRSLGVSLLNVVLESSGPALFLKYPPLRHIMTEEISWSLIRSAYMTSSSSLSTLSSGSPHTAGGGGSSSSSSGHSSSLSANRYIKDASMLTLSVLLRAVLYLHSYCPPPKRSMIQIELMKSVFFRVLNSPLHVIFFQPSPTLSLLFGGGGGGAPGGGSTSSSTSATTALLTSQYHTFLQQLEDKVFPYDYRYLTLESLVELCCSSPDFLLHLFISFDCNIHSDTDACSEILAILSFVVLSPPLPLLPTLQQIQMAASSSSSSGGRSTKKVGPGIGGCLSSLQDAVQMYLPPYHGVYRHPAYVTLYEDGKPCLYNPFDAFRQISRVPFSMFYSYPSSSDVDMKSSSTGSSLGPTSPLNLDSSSSPSFLSFTGLSSSSVQHPLGRSGGLLFLGSGKSTGGGSSYAAMMTAGDHSMKGRGNLNLSSNSNHSAGGGRKGVGAGGAGVSGVEERRKELSGLSRLALRGLLNVLSTSATRVERIAAKRVSSRKKKLSSRNIIYGKMRRRPPPVTEEGEGGECLATTESSVSPDQPLSGQNNHDVVSSSQCRVNKIGVDPSDENYAKMIMMNRAGTREHDKEGEDQGTELELILRKGGNEEEEERTEEQERQQKERSAAACALCDALIQSGEVSAVKAFGMVQELSRLSERRERKRRLALGLMVGDVSHCSTVFKNLRPLHGESLL